MTPTLPEMLRAEADRTVRVVSMIGTIQSVTYKHVHDTATRALLREAAEAVELESARLDYIERNFSAVTTQERYLPLRMIWGKGCNGRTLREACDKYMKRDAPPTDAAGGGA